VTETTGDIDVKTHRSRLYRRCFENPFSKRELEIRMTTISTASQTEDHLDPDIVTFLETIADSLVKWDLIRFFNDNPHAIDPAQTIAHFSSRETRDVERQLDALVDAGALNIRLVSGTKAYMLTTDAQMRARIQRFLQACDDKQVRLQAIRYVIRLTTQHMR